LAEVKVSRGFEWKNRATHRVQLRQWSGDCIFPSVRGQKRDVFCRTPHGRQQHFGRSGRMRETWNRPPEQLLLRIKRVLAAAGPEVYRDVIASSIRHCYGATS
jgi:hypothetical protein